MSIRSEDPDNILLTLDGTYLSLAGQKLISIPKLADKKSPQNELLVDIVQTLDVSLNHLSDISNVNHFKKLRSLILDHNYLSHGDFKGLQPLDTVTTLWLNNNNITDLDEALRSLSRAFPNMTYLSLLRNPCCPNNFIEDQKDAYQQYRRYVLSVLPKLEVLDASNVTEQERSSKDNVAPKFNSHLMTSPLRKDVMSFVKTKEGYLTVTTTSENVRWKPSWCVLGDCMLLHYRSKESAIPERVIGLEGYKVITVEGTDMIKADKPLFAFQLKHEKKESVYLLFETKETMQDWLYFVNEQVKFAAVSKKSEAEQRRAQYEILEEERRKYYEEEEKRIKQELEDRFRSVTQQTHFVTPQEIKLVRVLGHGSFGTVYQGIVRSKEVAIKILHNRDLDEDAIDDFCNEVEIISKIHHPQVMLFLGASTQPGALMIIFELMKCDLEALLLNKERKLGLLTKLRLAKDAALGMGWLHGADPMIIHRDVKTRNFLVDENLRVVVSDFGFAEKLRQGRSTYDDRGTWKGTSFFMAPEVLTGSQFNEKSDVYSFAIVLWEIYCRQRVYLDLVGSDIRKFIKMISFEGYRPPIPEDCPKSYAQLLQACWAHDADQRPGFEEIVRMINQLIIEQAISDPNGRKFWEENFADKDRVQWKMFYQALKPMLSDMDDKALAIFKLFLVRKYNNEAHSKNAEYVLIERFGKLLEWFGPLHPSNDIVSRMSQLIRQKWFHGDLTAHESLTRLMDKAPGTYLVRLGHTVGCFTLCYIDQERVIHCHSIEKRAHIENDEKVVEELVLEGKGEVNIYTSLEELIAAQSYLSEPCAGSPYMWLFHRVTYVAHSLLDDSFDTLEPTYFVREKN